jgi:hypothetical protein
MAYYCYKYALDKAVEFNSDKNLPEVSGFIMSQLLPLVEQMKSTLSLDFRGDSASCTQFALDLFAEGVKMDDNKTTNKSTAKLFKTAYDLFDVLLLFGDISPDIKEKRKWANYRCVNILKAEKEGRPMTLDGPSNQSASLSVDDSSGSSEYEAPNAHNASANTSFSSSSNYPTTNNIQTNVPPASQGIGGTVFGSNNGGSNIDYSNNKGGGYSLNQPMMTSSTSSSSPRSPASGGSRGAARVKDDPRVADALELTLFAIAALKRSPHDGLAREQLQAALARLESQ